MSSFNDCRSVSRARNYAACGITATKIPHAEPPVRENLHALQIVLSIKNDRMKNLSIIEARSIEDYAAARSLIQQYANWLGVDLEFQGFSKELASLETMYGPPLGAILLACLDGTYVGCVGLRPLERDIAEMKRMFVVPEHHGKGIGRMLLESFIAKARALDYKAIRLDTVPRLDAATAMYRRHGFVDITPYRYNPAPDAIFLELKL